MEGVILTINDNEITKEMIEKAMLFVFFVEKIWYSNS